MLLQRLDTSLKKNTPWLVLAGSGSAADLISELLDPSDGEVEAAQIHSAEHRDRIRENIRKHFPAKAGQAELEELVNRVSSVVIATLSFFLLFIL